MDTVLLRLLTDTGFNEKEALVYLSLLELGSGKVNDIHKLTKIKRPVIYSVVEVLIRRGYVSQLPDKKVKRFIATEPTKILRHLQTNALNFKEMIPVFTSLLKKTTGKPKIQYFEGREGVASVYKEISHFPEALFVTSMERLRTYFSEEVDNWIQGFQSGRISMHGKHILSQSLQDKEFAEQVLKHGQEVRFLPEDRVLEMDVSLYGNYVALSSFDEQLFIVVIQSDGLTRSFRVLFDMLWKVAKKR